METEMTTGHDKLSEFIQKYCDFFDNPHWCPLFGDLPQVVYNPKSQAYLCWEIIEGARYLWHKDPYIETDDSLCGTISQEGEYINFPWVFENYPDNLLKTARTIVECYDSTTQHTTERAITEDGFQDNQTLLSNLKCAVEFIKGYHRGLFFDNEIEYDEKKDYLIIAAFAIAEAKDTLEEILTGEKENNPRIIEQVQVAQGLLYEAEKRFEAVKIQRKGGKKKAENKKSLYEEIKEHEKQVRAKYQYYKEDAIATTIWLERKKQKKPKPARDRIYKIIKTTS